MASYKNPPSLSDGVSCDSWRSEVDIWRRMTDIAETKQALAVKLSLTGQYKEVAISVSVNQLNSDEGMDALLAVMDANFQKESVDSAYEAYHNFEVFRRGDLSMSSFLIEFERRYTKLKSHCLSLPEEIQGCKLLEVADLQQSQKQMLLSAFTSLKYSDVKRVLRRIFVGISESAEGEIRVKQEAFFAGKHSSRKWDKRKDDRKSDTQKQGGGVEKRTNPRNKQGHITRCMTCGSIFHYVKDCPDSNNAGSSKRVSSHKNASSSVEEALEAQGETEEESESMVTFAMFSGLQEPEIGAAFATNLKLLNEC